MIERRRIALKKRIWTKAALAISVCLFIAWWMLGTGATLAWFSDTDHVRNSFQVGLLKMDVAYWSNITEDYEPLMGATEAFDRHALYEPGYTQVVYLRINNTGRETFNYKLAVTVQKVNKGYNAWGDEIYLPDYLRYGVVFGKTEAEVRQQVQDRLAAREQAPETWGRLDTWGDKAPYPLTAAEECHYAALIVYMPEEVGNVANYRGAQPSVDLGITVRAQQANAPMN